MHTIFWVIGMLVLPVLSVFFVVYPRRIKDAPWYGHGTESLYLYLFPPGFMFLGVACAAEVFERMGAPWPFWLEAVTIVPALLLTLVGFLGMMGVPMPGPLTPKWVRERRKKDRQAKRRRREQRRERRRADREAAG